MFKRYSNLALSAAIILFGAVSTGPAWCAETGSAANFQKDLARIEGQLALKPRDVVLIAEHAELMKKLKRYEDEILDGAKLIAINPKLKDGYLYKAQGQALLDRNLDAIESLDKVFSLGGATPSTLILKARLLRKEKRYAEAITIANRVIKENPSDSNAYDCRAGCYYSLYGPCSNAIADLEAVVRLDPSDSSAKALIVDLKRKMASPSNSPAK